MKGLPLGCSLHEGDRLAGVVSGIGHLDLRDRDGDAHELMMVKAEERMIVRLGGPDSRAHVGISGLHVRQNLNDHSETSFLLTAYRDFVPMTFVLGTGSRIRQSSI